MKAVMNTLKNTIKENNYNKNGVYEIKYGCNATYIGQNYDTLDSINMEVRIKNLHHLC